MKGLSLREKVLVIVLVIAALFYGYYRFYLNPMLSSINKTESSIEALKVEEKKIKEAPAKKEELTKEHKDEAVRFKDAVMEIPRHYRNSEIAYDLKAICDVNLTVLKSISLGIPSAASPDGTPATDANATQTTSGAKLYSVPVVLSITGNYDATMDLIDAIENDTRTAQVESIGTSAGAAGEGLTTSLSLTYYYIDNGEASDEIYDFNNGDYGKENLFN